MLDRLRGRKLDYRPALRVGAPRVLRLTAAPTHIAPELPIERAILLVSQTFPPDPAAVGQHFGDLARALALRGHRVVVLTSASGYDDPTVRYPEREVTDEGVEIKRLRLSSLGKQSFSRRIVASLAFMLQALVEGLRIRRLGTVVFSTSPPFIGLVAVVIRAVRRVGTVYWVMDLNPDQLIALGKIKRSGIFARSLRALHGLILRFSTRIVALDQIMAERIIAAHDDHLAIDVIPPWSPDGVSQSDNAKPDAFREAHGLENVIVVMYSGNHTISNPLTTLLRAAVRIKDDPRVRFVFVGGGAGKAEVEQFRREHALDNVLSLPYQPRAELATSLSAADVHIVSLGDGMAGIIHPCKVYGAMAVGRPILYFGPDQSHVSGLLTQYQIGWQVAHGDVDAAVDAVNAVIAQTAIERQRMGERARAAIEDDLAPELLCARVCEVVEQELGRVHG